MALIDENGAMTAREVAIAHPLRPILYLVFSLKIAVAAVLLASVTLAPPVAAEGSYMAAN
jgi:hypothetical protein